MMREKDRDAFYALVTSTYGFYRTGCTAFALGVWWDSCKRFSLSSIEQALKVHAGDAARGQFLPYPADVVKILTPDAKNEIEICDHCGGEFVGGWTALRSGRVCNPCYAGYLAGKWSPERAA